MVIIKISQYYTDYIIVKCIENNTKIAFDEFIDFVKLYIIFVKSLKYAYRSS